nr:MAG TPA: hypothetical protein [Caudoviricetes sp.]
MIPLPLLCCHDCKSRHIGCHIDCEKYIREKREYDVLQSSIRKEKSYDGYIAGRKLEIKQEYIKKYGKIYK